MPNNNLHMASCRNWHPRVIALDLDFTLLRSNATLSARNLAALQACAARAILPIIATARPPRSIKRLLPPDFPPGPHIAYSGAAVYENGACIQQNALEPDLAIKTINYLTEILPEMNVSIEMDDRMFATRPIEGPWVYEVLSDLTSVIDRPVAKIFFEISSPDNFQTVRDGLPDSCKLIWDNRFAYIVAPHASKARALGFLLKRLGWAFDDVIAFGDSATDIEMLQTSRLGIAVANADVEAKAAADYITSSNDDDGVAKVLEQLL